MKCKELKMSSLPNEDCDTSLENLLLIRHHCLRGWWCVWGVTLLLFLHFTFCPYPHPVMWLAVLVESATQSPITRKGCEVYESDYGPIFPEIRTLSLGSSGPHGAIQAWPQTRVVFSLLSLLIAVKQLLCLRVKQPAKRGQLGGKRQDIVCYLHLSNAGEAHTNVLKCFSFFFFPFSQLTITRITLGPPSPNRTSSER